MRRWIRQLWTEVERDRAETQRLRQVSRETQHQLADAVLQLRHVTELLVEILDKEPDDDDPPPAGSERPDADPGSPA